MTECPNCKGILERNFAVKSPNGFQALKCKDCKKGWMEIEKYINAINIKSDSITHNKNLSDYENDTGNNKI
jgi:hypothetical protein